MNSLRTIQPQSETPRNLLRKVRTKRANFSSSLIDKYSNSHLTKLQTVEQFQNSNPFLISKINMFDHSENINEEEDKTFKTVDLVKSVVDENQKIICENQKNSKFQPQNQMIKAVINVQKNFRSRHRKSIAKCQHIQELSISKKTIAERSKDIKLDFNRQISSQKCKRKERPTKILLDNKFRLEKKFSILSPW